MNKRLAVVLAFALVVSAGASFFLYKVINARLGSTQAGATHEAIVAAKDLGVGTLIKDIDVKAITLNSPPPPNAVKKLEDAAGRGVVAAIYEGEPILEHRLAAKGAGAGMAATIPMGMRAVAMRVDDVAGVAGFVTPGQRVDVLIMGAPPNWSPALGTLSKTLLQNIEVLSAGQQVQKDTEGKPISVPVVNLLVTPEQAEILSLASSQARIQLILRNPMDKEDSKTTGVAFASLFSGSQALPATTATPQAAQPRPRAKPVPPRPPAVAKPVPVPVPLVVEIIHGSRKAETKFPQETKPQDTKPQETKKEEK
ncbi:MAG: Flp pilus assembly protein CpaB [Acidobacteriia bacterium]|nr:Flp pilus assembly protein CpaB [Terriglobia bacterium]